jgi:DNA-binding IclR family transcriptional regulator
MRNSPDRLSAIASLRKGIDVLFLFTEAEPALRLGEIAARLGLPKSTTSRFVSTLRHAGLLTQEPETRRYQLGTRLLALEGALLRAARDLPALARPFLRELADRSGETAHLTERRGSVGVITELVESAHVLRMAPRRGQRVLLHAGALARTILAFQPRAEIERILRCRPPERLAPGTPGSAATVRRALAETRRLGYAVTLEEINTGACGIAAPIFGRDEWAVGSLGVSGPVSRLTAERRRELVGPVCRAARELSQLIRHHPEIVAAPARALSAGG